MKAAEIVDAIGLQNGKTLTPERVAKVKRLCDRMKVPVADVIALLPVEEQEKLR